MAWNFKKVSTIQCLNTNVCITLVVWYCILPPEIGQAFMEAWPLPVQSCAYVTRRFSANQFHRSSTVLTSSSFSRAFSLFMAHSLMGTRKVSIEQVQRKYKHLFTSHPLLEHVAHVKVRHLWCHTSVGLDVTPVLAYSWQLLRDVVQGLA